MTEKAPGSNNGPTSYPEDIAKSALTRLKKLVRGNGIKPDTLAFQKLDGRIETLSAQRDVLFHAKITEETKRRASSPNQAPNRDAAAAKLNDLTNKAFETLFIKDAKTYIKNLPEWGLKDNISPPVPYPVHCAYPDTCPSCQGQGKEGCKNCNGRGRELCRQCHGDGITMCPECHGQSYINGPNGQRQLCPRCQGRGKNICNNCQQRGDVDCRSCKGQGSVFCQDCEGAGKVAVEMSLRFSAESRLQYETADLTPAAADFVTKHTSLVSEKHADIAFETKIDHPSEEEKLPNLSSTYKIHLPLAEATIKAGKQNIFCQICGKQGELTDMKPFLEGPLQPLQNILSKSLSQKGDSHHALTKALRARYYREALTTHLSLSRKKAVQKLAQYYHPTLSRGFIEESRGLLLKHFGRLAQAAKTFTAPLGALISLLAFASYYFTPLRLKTLALVQTEWAAQILETIIMIIGAGCGFVIYSILQATQIKKKASDLPGIKAAQIRNPAGLTEWGFIPIVILLMILLVFFGPEVAPSDRGLLSLLPR